ncbi:formylmethanofuran dehydrogenase [candidate division MSBL1 archaeon SCGC-AAA382A03]|uniref:Formylmethanofuran dehydrogenase n=1 Tax=candidate division MSBL1 archaeon SCGC-AAA382A03 TaxID=1698278 RepID=A0A133VFK4_9EURY|nr:formylmethanofuran dehydrogenase [candidate division MSBL1 archaeon SCGC-AAA382A03]
MSKTINDVVCPYCGCLCDDIGLVMEENKIKDTINSCKISHTKFCDYMKSEERITEPMIKENGEFEPVSLEEAVEKAADILSDSDSPLLYGWSSTTCESQETGVALSELLGGVLDNTSSVCHDPSILAEQGVGVSTCTLGQVKNRADLIIYWGCNPAHAHPRHLSRYSFYPRGFFTRSGERDRNLVVVDIRKTDTAKIADKFVQVNPNQDYELLNAVRTYLKGGDLPEKVAGVPAEDIKELAEIMKESKFGVVFFGLGLTMSDGKLTNIDNAISLVRDLNDHTKFTIMPMRGHFNVAGANKVSCWETRFPYAVDFARGYPRYSPGENSVVDMLSNKEADAAMIVASDPAANLPGPALEHLREIPSITIDPHMTPTAELSEIYIPSAISGIEAEGTAYRMDGVPIKLKKIMDPPEGIMTDEKILEMVKEKTKGKK